MRNHRSHHIVMLLLSLLLTVCVSWSVAAPPGFQTGLEGMPALGDSEMRRTQGQLAVVKNLADDVVEQVQKYADDLGFLRSSPKTPSVAQDVSPFLSGSAPAISNSVETPFMRSIIDFDIKPTDRVIVQGRPLSGADKFTGKPIAQHSSIIITDSDGLAAKAIFTHGPDAHGNVRLIPNSKPFQRDIKAWLEGGEGVVVQEYRMNPLAVVEAARRVDDHAQSLLLEGKPLKYKLGSCNCNTSTSKVLDLAMELQGQPAHLLPPAGTRVLDDFLDDPMSTLIGWGAQHRSPTLLEGSADRFQGPIMGLLSNDISANSYKSAVGFQSGQLEEFVSPLVAEGRTIAASVAGHIKPALQSSIPTVARSQLAREAAASVGQLRNSLKHQQNLFRANLGAAPSARSQQPLFHRARQ